MKYQVKWTGHFDYPDVCVIDATTGYVVNRVNRCRTVAATIREAQILADILNVESSLPAFVKQNREYAEQTRSVSEGMYT